MKAQRDTPTGRIQSLSALTLATRDMMRSVEFYRALGFEVLMGGDDAEFTILKAGAQRLNLTRAKQDFRPGWWGRPIFHVDDVDSTYRAAVEAGLSPAFAPRDASWGERYFHITDPDGHELSFAHPLEP